MQKATGLLQKRDKKLFEVAKSVATIPMPPLAKRSSEYSVSRPESTAEMQPRRLELHPPSF